MGVFINAVLATGRELQAVTRQLESSRTDLDRPGLNEKWQDLHDRRHGQILEALQNGVEVKTLEFAMEFHGHGATEDLYRDGLIPAEALRRHIEQFGAENTALAWEETR